MTHSLHVRTAHVAAPVLTRITPGIAIPSTALDAPKEWRPRYDPALGLLVFPAWPVASPNDPLLTLWDPRYPAVLCWGLLFPLGSRAQLSQYNPHIERLLELSLPARHSLYRHTLRGFATKAWFSEDERHRVHGVGLTLEDGEWQRHAYRRLLGRLGSRIDNYQALTTNRTADHTLWTARMAPRPSVDYEGSVQVPVHRLLWALYRPDDLLTDQDRPRKDPEWCSDEGELLRCVNPWHFEYASATRPGTNGRGVSFRADPLSQGYRPRWNRWEDVARDAQGNEFVACRYTQNHPDMTPVPLQGGAQEDFQAGKTKGRGYCPVCYQKWLLTTVRVPRRRYYSRVVSVRSPAMIEQEAKRQVEAERNQREIEKAERILDTYHPQEGEVVYQADENDPWPGPASA